MFETPLFSTLLLFVLGAAQLALAVFVGWQRRLHEWGERLLVGLLAITGLWEWAQGLSPWVTTLGSNSLSWLAATVLILHGLLFFCSTWVFLRRPGRRLAWGLLAVGGLALVGVLTAVPANSIRFLPVSPANLALGLAAFVWAIYLGATILHTIAAYRLATQPLHRNRLLYWFLAIVLVIMAGLTLLVSGSVVGGVLRLAALAALTYIVTNHRLPDVRRNALTAVTYALLALVSAVVYVLAITLLEFGLRNVYGSNDWLVLGFTILFVAALLQPLLQLVQRLAIRRQLGAAYESSDAMHNYGARISNILDMERLAQTVTALVSETMGTEVVRLLLVDHLRQDGHLVYRLQTTAGPEQAATLAGTLASDNPVAMYLAVNDRPLAQYDIDLLPRYRKMPEDERRWLADLHNDVYVPIHSRGQWIGLLTVGPKLTADRYFDQDMQLLNTLADQTAIALENARLVSDLVSLNRDLKQAFADLERAHHQLNELDRLKSAFIGAITHELRTPVANLQFSIQLIDKYGLENMSPDQREQFRQLSDEARHAKTMVDNLVNFATFLGKQGELKLADFSFSEVLAETVITLEPHARRKSQTLRMDVADEGLPPVHGDRARLSDAAYHLIQNAIKFTGPGGAVTARCRAKEGQFIFEVTDNGVGVPPEKLESLWEGFNQMADPLKRGLEGLGLGLALVKYVVTAHGGQTIAQSSGLPGEGSTFGFTIPLAGPQAALETGAPVTPPTEKSTGGDPADAASSDVAASTQPETATTTTADSLPINEPDGAVEDRTLQ